MNESRRGRILTIVSKLGGDLTLGALFLTLYTLTLAPGLLPADSGEFQSIVPLLGVAHPPGFALYTLLGKLFTLLIPTGSPAWRLNLFSAITSTLTLLAVYRAGRLLDKSGWLAWSSALALGLSTTFWAQATTANIRSLTGLLAALIVWAWLWHWQQPSPRRLTWLSLALGAGVVHHASLAFMGVVLGLAALWRAEKRPLRPFIGALASGLIWLLVLLYLPLRNGSWLAPDHLNTLGGFIEHALATGFEGDFFYYAQLAALPERGRILLNIALFQFGGPLLVLLLLGLLAAFRPDWRVGLTLALAIAVHAFIAITYRAPQTVEYLLPAYVVLAIAAAALGAAIPAWEGKWPRLVAALVMLTALPLLAQNWTAYRWLAAEDSTHTEAESLLQAAPPGSIILANWHRVTPLWYLQGVEGQRPDIEARYVFPQGDSLEQTWVDLVAEYRDTRPVVVTGFYPAAFAAAGYRFEPLGPGWLLVDSSTLTTSLDPVGEQFGEHWQLHSTSPPPASAHPGDTLDLAAVWQTTGPPEAINFFVQLIGPDGQLYGGADVNHPGDNYASGDLLAGRYPLLVAQNALPGEYQLVAGVYRPDGTRYLTPDSADVYLLGMVTIGPALHPPASTHPRWAGPLAGYDYDHSLPGQMRLWLHWRLDDSPREWTLFSGEQLIGSFNVPGGSGYISTAHDLPAEWSGWRLESDGGQSIDLKPARPGDRYVPLGGALVLTGVEVRSTADGAIEVELAWQAARPLTVDAVVKVDLTGEDYAWRSASDGIPAGGAIPTLKWIPGPLIYDRHTLPIPGGATAPPERLELAVYDHFTQRVYAIGDPRLAGLGTTVPLALP